ncbi:MAG: hypothetical protein AB1609_19890 [Bacillota bacterium]
MGLLGNGAWEQLVEALVEGIRIDTVHEEGRKTAKVTIRYRVHWEIPPWSQR